MTIQFRPAAPKDTDTVVPLIFSSGPGAFDYIFSRDKRRAQALYERLGFQVTGHRPSALEGVPSHNRMEREL